MPPPEPFLSRAARWLTFGSAVSILLSIAVSQILLALALARDQAVRWFPRLAAAFQVSFESFATTIPGGAPLTYRDHLGPASIPAALAAQVNQLSSTQDAWAISTVPPATLKPPAAVTPAAGAGLQSALQKIVSASGGVKFGSVVVVTGQAQAATPKDASALADVLKLFVNMAQLQAAKRPETAALAQSLVVSTQGSTVKITLSLPEGQFQQLVKPKAAARKAVQM